MSNIKEVIKIAIYNRAVKIGLDKYIVKESQFENLTNDILNEFSIEFKEVIK